MVSCSFIKKFEEPNTTFDSWRNTKRYEIKNTLLEVGDKYDFDTNDNYLNNNEALNMSKLLTTPPPPPIGNGELISFSITEEVSLKDVFIELGRLADVDIQIDPQISGGIILKITDKPLNVVIDEICDIANLKYEYNNGILKIEKDLPYSVDYYVDILSEHELWSDIQASIEYLLSIHPVKNVKNGDIGASADAGLSSLESNDDLEQKISINKASNIISVYANSKAQKAIADYIKKSIANYASQVLIEAKVVEVKLNDVYQAGIDWNLTKTTTDSSGATMTDTLLNIVGASGAEQGIRALSFDKKIKSRDLNVVIDAMQEFGDTKTLSSPRISALNNQKARLDFTKTIVYFSIEKEEESNSYNGGVTKEYTYTSTKEEEEVGVKLEITPIIDLKNGDITLNVKPELSSLIGYVSDPVTPENKVPQIQKRTLETSLKIKSGEVMVIGGLMSESIDNTTKGVPFLMNIPVLGNLFKYKSSEKELTETVIFIKATIVDKDNPLTNNKDEKLFNDFKTNKSYYKD